MSEWQPIETAPKDGSEILACFPNKFAGANRADYSIVRWEHGRWIAQADGQRAIESQGDTWTDYISPFITFWMPLPAPPISHNAKPDQNESESISQNRDGNGPNDQ